MRKDRPVGVLADAGGRRVRRPAGRATTTAASRCPDPFFADEVERVWTTSTAGTLLVMERVPGAKAGEYFPDLAAPTAHRRAIGEQLAAALARLHSLPLDDSRRDHASTSPPTVTRRASLAAVEGMAGAHRRAQRTAHRSRSPGAAVAARPCSRRRARRTGSASCWGDVGLHNMLVDGDRVTALVDWEAATVGPPARELAAVWPAATALMAWEEFVDAYRAAGGPPEADGSARRRLLPGLLLPRAPA